MTFDCRVKIFPKWKLTSSSQTGLVRCPQMPSCHRKGRRDRELWALVDTPPMLFGLLFQFTELSRIWRWEAPHSRAFHKVTPEERLSRRVLQILCKMGERMNSQASKGWDKRGQVSSTSRENNCEHWGWHLLTSPLPAPQTVNFHRHPPKAK